MTREEEAENIFRFEELLRRISESNRDWRGKRDYTDDKETDGVGSGSGAGGNDEARVRLWRGNVSWDGSDESEPGAGK